MTTVPDQLGPQAVEWLYRLLSTPETRDSVAINRLTNSQNGLRSPGRAYACMADGVTVVLEQGAYPNVCISYSYHSSGGGPVSTTYVAWYSLDVLGSGGDDVIAHAQGQDNSAVAVLFKLVAATHNQRETPDRRAFAEKMSRGLEGRTL